MTQQYLQQNINNGGGASSFVSSVAIPDITLAGSSDQTLQVDPTAAASTVTLPLAVEAGANTTVTVINTTGADDVTVAVQGADSFISAAGSSLTLSAAGSSLTLRSNGEDAWLVVPTAAGSQFTSVIGVVGTTTLSGAGNQLVVVDTSAAGQTIELPLAAEAGANARVTVLQAVGATATITVAVQAGDALGPVPASFVNPIAAVAGQGLTLISDGAGTWYFEAQAI